ncbi:MerR family DNA-binding transcriptional regulator [Nocardioides guangzhouensis]|uniref:MerR family DNA-binding transcriptional regulator n=1 Tax=Nocardioides guangzhouensis TaxID=2497878 RepID=A0A4Q4ZIK3_9ACTN|nr:DICT sensory domain-containing protein [Nocardioides guangzhouensis]RYP87194.1 MerR family DNA-binding transcriptional regulator [Nocardioides guangzhouensis]
MTTTGPDAQGVAPDRDQTLAIGELAARTGLTPAVLRMWEQRHGFPRPQRLDSGHRRYAASDVAAIEGVLRRRDAGVRLDVAIAEAARMPDRPTASVYAELRRRHPHLAHQRLRKATLLALSWAIEDECAARAQQAVVFGAFQEPRHFRGARPRWRDLARVARHAVVLGGADEVTTDGRLTLVPLTDDAPLRGEWAVVCDAPGFTAALSAWEVPGQRGVAEPDRVFESAWTVEPGPVRDAARVCADVALAAGAPHAADVRRVLEPEPARAADPTATAALLQRVLGHLDRPV